MAQAPVSFILATYNRAAVVAETLCQLVKQGFSPAEYDTWVVDNCSADDTLTRLRAEHPAVKLLPLRQNRGSCAKALAVLQVTTPYVIFLDDDSWPDSASVTRMVEYFYEQPKLGAAGFMVNLPDGSQESSALPNVFVGCGVGFRTECLREVGNLDLSYFMQAEEYDLSFRLVAAGYEVRNFTDLKVRHEKTATTRSSDRRLFYDVRNNETLALTYLPEPWLTWYRQDWQQRYRWLAEDEQLLASYRTGRRAGWRRGWWRRFTRPKAQLRPSAMNTLFGIELLNEQFAKLKHLGTDGILLADLGKNIYAYYQAARQAGVRVAAVTDDRFARAGRSYRGCPIVSLSEGLQLPISAVVISNSSPVHARLRQQWLIFNTRLPVHRWFSDFG
ncbi:MAG: hypothetical protein HJJLKODD_01988 [Phycisphaerae bacterium]|nr:hypothetical protein [Phycisphaerae bacterium]